jgi:hypothetical protein
MDAAYVGSFGLVMANLMLLNVRAFARSQGLSVRWWSRSYTPEREHLRMLARTSDPAVARRARFYLRLEMLAWTTFLLAGVLLVWAIAHRVAR